MLRTQRRSNFRDQALQRFGSGAAGDAALFERVVASAELTFASLPPR